MATYANRTCVVCGLRRPQYDMRQVEKTVKSGHSGVSLSLSLKPTMKSTRLNSGRNYYRKQVVWECASSQAHHDPGYFRRKEIEDKKRKEQETVRKAEQARLELEKQQKQNLAREEQRRIDSLKARIKSSATVALKDVHLNRQLDKKIKGTKKYRSIESQYREQLVKKYQVQTLDFDGFFKQVVGGIGDADRLCSNKFRAKKLAKAVVRKPENNLRREAKIRVSGSLLGPQKIFGWVTIFWVFMWILGLTVGSESPSVLFIPVLLFGLPYAVIWLATRKARKVINTLSDLAQESFRLYASHVLEVAQASVLKEPIAAEPGALSLIDNFFSDLCVRLTGTTQAGAKNTVSEQADTVGIGPPVTQTPVAAPSRDGSQYPDINETAKSTAKTRHKKSSSDGSELKNLVRSIFYSDNFFDISCFILMCRVAHVDHDFGEQEKKFVTEAVRLSSDEFTAAESFMAVEKHKELLIKMLLKKYPKNDVALLELVNNLFFVAESDGTVTPDEIVEIKAIATALGVSREDFDQILRESLVRDEENRVVREPCFVEELFDDFGLDND